MTPDEKFRFSSIFNLTDIPTLMEVRDRLIPFYERYNQESEALNRLLAPEDQLCPIDCAKARVALRIAKARLKLAARQPIN